MLALSGGGGNSNGEGEGDSVENNKVQGEEKKWWWLKNCFFKNKDMDPLFWEHLNYISTKTLSNLQAIVHHRFFSCKAAQIAEKKRGILSSFFSLNPCLATLTRSYNEAIRIGFLCI